MKSKHLMWQGLAAFCGSIIALGIVLGFAYLLYKKEQKASAGQKVSEPDLPEKRATKETDDSDEVEEVKPKKKTEKKTEKETETE